MPLYDVLVKPGHGIDPRVIVEMNDVVVAERDIFAVDTRRADQPDVLGNLLETAAAWGQRVHAERVREHDL